VSANIDGASMFADTNPGTGTRSPGGREDRAVPSAADEQEGYTGFMGLFRRRDDEQLAVLRAEMSAVHEQLDAAERSRAELASELGRLTGELDDRINATVDTQVTAQIEARRERPITSTPTPPPPPPMPPPIDSRADHERIERIEERLGEIAASTERLDERVTNVSTELANQLTELSSDIDYVAQGLPPGSHVSPLDPELIEARLRKQLDEEIDAKLGIELDEVRDNSERLALEQARYEIRFRQDLADLADRLRRPGPD
jgi:DNA repair exonuclease SbcCD ATPase subunit